MPKYRLRRAQSDPQNIHSISEEDTAYVEGLDRLCFPIDDRYPIEDRWWWIVETEDGHPVAYAGLAPLPQEPGVMFLCRAGVLPEHRRKGLAQKLVKARLRFAKSRSKMVITYVDMHNVASGNNLIKAGLKLHVPNFRYGGDGAIYFSLDF